MRKPQLPSALEWDHNRHYHRWLLRQLLVRRAREQLNTALDVGCGTGELARALAGRVGQVDAVDPSDEMIREARERSSPASSVRWVHGDFLNAELPLPVYDAVTASSSLHHMPLLPALARLARLVAPGGILIVVGPYRPMTIEDFALDALAVPANAAVGAVVAARGRGGKAHDPNMPIISPTTTLAEIREAAAAAVPGARLRRQLFWRYSLVWQRRAEDAPQA